MPTFAYIARDRESNRRSGTLTSEDLKSAVSSLTQQGFIPIRVTREKELRSLQFGLDRLFFSRMLFLSVFSSSFSRLLTSGLTVPQAVSVLSKQFRKGYAGKAIQDLLEKLHQGHKLSDVMTDMPKLFPRYLAALCQAGEESGCLPEVLEKASAFFERLRLLKNRLVSALIYPSFLAVLSLATIALLFSLVLPRITAIYEQLNADLPWQTDLLIGLGNIVSSHPEWLIAIALVLIVSGGLLSWRFQGRSIGKNLKYHIPFIGNILSRAELADQLSVTGLLVQHSVGLPKALRVTTSLAGLPLQKSEFEHAANEVEAGRSFADSVASARTIPSFVKDKVGLGEEADCLPESLENGSSIVKSEVDQKLVVFTTLFEPLMVLFMALLIGFIVFSVLLPIFNVDFLAS